MARGVSLCSYTAEHLNQVGHGSLTFTVSLCENFQNLSFQFFEKYSTLWLSIQSVACPVSALIQRSLNLNHWFAVLLLCKSTPEHLAPIPLNLAPADHCVHTRWLHAQVRAAVEPALWAQPVQVPCSSWSCPGPSAEVGTLHNPPLFSFQGSLREHKHQSWIVFPGSSGWTEVLMQKGHLSLYLKNSIKLSFAKRGKHNIRIEEVSGIIILFSRKKQTASQMASTCSPAPQGFLGVTEMYCFIQH